MADSGEERVSTKYRDRHAVNDEDFIRIWIANHRDTAVAAKEYKITVVTACRIINRVSKQRIADMQEEHDELTRGSYSSIDDMMLRGVQSLADDLLSIKDPEKRLKVIVGLGKNRRDIEEQVGAVKPVTTFKGIEVLERLAGGETWEEIMGGEIPKMLSLALTRCVDREKQEQRGQTLEVHLSNLLGGLGTAGKGEGVEAPDLGTEEKGPVAGSDS